MCQGHRWFASLYDRMTGPAERRLLGKLRARILEDLQGRVLEIGIGTGASLPYYPSSVELVGIEPDPYMMRRAEKRRAALARQHIELRLASAERLPFADASFDHVVGVLVLCTVPDQSLALAEVRRVLKPGGTVRFIEHVRNDESRVWGTVQDVITPVWRWCGAGCHPNRRTEHAIREAGFHIDEVERVPLAPGTYAIVGRAVLT